MQPTGQPMAHVAGTAPQQAPLDRKAGGPAAVASLAQAQRALADAVSGMNDLALPTLLCECVRDGTLDFGLLLKMDASGHYAACVSELPPAAWRALDEVSRSQGRAVTRVVLPPPVAAGDLARVKQGLGELQALGLLNVQLPDGQASLDLSGARLNRDPRTGEPGPADVVLTLEGDLGHLQTVRTPTNVLARAADREHDGPTPRGIKVQLVDDKGLTHEQVTLANLDYSRRTPELEAEALRQGAGPQEAADVAQAMAMTLSLNMQARFGQADRKDAPLTSLVAHGDLIVCRHLGAQWNDDREAYQESRQDGKAGERFSMAKMTSVEAIAAHVDPATEEAARRMWHGRMTQGLFSVTRFGQALATECEAMVPGQARRFAIGTVNHYMSVEVQVKERHIDGRRRREYVVAFFDPNRTALPQRRVVHDLADLANKPLANWIGPAMEHAYFGPGPTRVGTLVRWGRSAPQAPVQDQLDEADRACGSYLHIVMRQNQAAQVTATVAQLLAAGRAEGEPRMSDLRGEAPDFAPALHLAAGMNAPGAAAAYVQAILQAVPGDLTMAQAAQLLEARHRGRTALMAAALESRDSQALWRMAQALLAAGGLDSWNRMGLLMADDDDNPSPLLKRLADAHGGAVDAGQPTSQDKVYAVVRSVAQAQTLETSHQMTLLDSEGAARQALDSGNPGAAAAMLCAVLETDLPAETKAMQLEAIGVSAEAVREALASLPDGGGAWTQRLADAAGLPPLPSAPPPEEGDSPG